MKPTSAIVVFTASCVFFSSWLFLSVETRPAETETIKKIKRGVSRAYNWILSDTRNDRYKKILGNAIKAAWIRRMGDLRTYCRMHMALRHNLPAFKPYMRE